MNSSESSSSTPIVKGKMTERNSLIRKEATRILLFKFTGCSGRFCEECCCQGHSVHGQGSLQSPLFGRTLKPIRRKESLLCIQFRSHFASTACNKYLKKELGKKKLTKLTLPWQMQVLGSCSSSSHRKHSFCQSTSQPIFTRPPKAPLWPGDQDLAKCQGSVVLYSPAC